MTDIYTTPVTGAINMIIFVGNFYAESRLFTVFSNKNSPALVELRTNGPAATYKNRIDSAISFSRVNRSGAIYSRTGE